MPLEPSAVGSTEAAPVHKAQAQRAGCGLDEGGKKVVIAHRLAVFHGLEYQVIVSVRFDGLVVPDGSAGATDTDLSFSV